MKRALLALAAIVWIAAGTGCHWQNAGLQGEQYGGSGCSTCGNTQGADGSCSTCSSGPISGNFFSARRAQQEQAEAMADGPPTAATAYPYYTTRGPRDFFANEPMSIGY